MYMPPKVIKKKIKKTKSLPRCSITPAKRTVYKKKNKKQIKGLKKYAKCASKARLAGCKKKQRKGAFQNPENPNLTNWRLSA